MRPTLPDMSPQPQVRQWVSNSLEVARQLQAKGSLRQACEAWKQIVAVSPGTKECYLGLADAAAACSRHEEAIDYYSQCLTLCANENNVDVLTKIGQSSLAAGDFQAALLYTQRALELRLAKNSKDTCDDLQVQLGKVLYCFSLENKI